jgi:hypothetical protein
MAARKPPPLSPNTVVLLTELLKEFKISAAHPNFDQVASIISVAKKELDALA